MSILHLSQDVIIPTEGTFGYVKGHADGMLLISSHDGLQKGWYHPEEVASLSLAHEQLRFGEVAVGVFGSERSENPTLHDPCAGCGGTFTEQEWSDRHTHTDELSDVHDFCCVTCNEGNQR